jgi:16S rRNA processing protein RimM
LTDATPAYLVVGRIGRAHGVRGELRLEILTDFPDRFAVGERFFIGPQDATSPDPVVLESVRQHRGRLLVRFDIADDRTEAQPLVGQCLLVPSGEARPLGPDRFYHHDLIGLEVVTDSGESIGRVASILETGSADVLRVHQGERQHLVPMIGDIIREIDLTGRRLVITPLPGLLD